MSNSESGSTQLAIKIFGVGSAGLTMLEQLVSLAGTEFVAVNTDENSLWASSAPEKVHLETKALRGLGTGGDPERGRAAAEEAFAKLKALCEGVQIVFIVAGLGGGAGSGISPVLARAAKQAGALVLGFVTVPFDCEGRRRTTIAREGLEALREAADGVVALPNQKIFKLIDENTSVLETFKHSAQLLSDCCKGIWRLLGHKGLIEIHLSDISSLLDGRHAQADFAVAEATGAARSTEIVQKLFSHPMLDAEESFAKSEAVLVSLVGGPDLTMAEVNRVMEEIQKRCETTQVIMGAAIDESYRNRLAVTVIAAGKAGEPSAEEEQPNRLAPSEELGAQLLSPAETKRPGSRFVPPAPTLPPEEMQKMLNRQRSPAMRPRKQATKMRQTQLPLEIVSKGRFDKSEPTIHRGEDLDVPTYIRRGVALN
ncbi:MAG TPA: cell division protein FtsZ [Candidatus Dormibacteraeota bacterium]|nr:cell division protein FtsZ [Candidatus Dormibacteraeota bacterium]